MCVKCFRKLGITSEVVGTSCRQHETNAENWAWQLIHGRPQVASDTGERSVSQFSFLLLYFL